MILEAKCIFSCNCYLGEGPLYNPINHHLYWIDILQKKLHWIENQDIALHHIYDLPATPGCLGYDQMGNLLVFMDTGCYRWIEHNRLEYVGKPEGLLEHMRFNDGKVNPYGEFIVGTMEKEGAEDRSVSNGSLYRMDLKGEFHLLKDKEFHIPNGLDWSMDHQFFYHIDSIKGQVTKYKMDNQNHMSAPQVIIDFENEQGVPDGMCMDAEGMLWIAHWGGYQVTRWDPNSGQKLLTVKVNSENVTCVTFGGSDLKTLYITTAGLNRNKDSHEGGLFAIDLDIKGRVGYTSLI